MARSVLVLEFNELSGRLINRFIDQGLLPNFERMRSQSVTALTDAEEAPPFLEPWIQWVTVHTGLPYSDHKCFELNDGAKLQASRIWDRVSQAGGKVWICGSMNAGVSSGSINGFVLPDPWADTTKAMPPDFFTPYSSLVRAYVQEHSSGKTNVGTRDFARFARFMIANGLSAKTIWRTVRQLAGEFRRPIRWRRPTILDDLQWDLFKSIYRQERPTFSTFFLNSTAHFQHFHWREMEPELFQVQPDSRELDTFGQTIAFGYRQMDRLLGEAMDLVDSDTTIVLCTALSQKPMLTHEEIGGRQIFRHKDVDALLRFAGVTQAYDYAPVMSQQFLLSFSSEEDAADAAEKIDSLRVDGSPLMLARRNGTQVISGALINRPPCADALIRAPRSNDALKFWDHFYPLEALRSGMHDPQGVLWIRTPMRIQHRMDRKVSLLEIAPTLLALTGVDAAGVFQRPPMEEVTSLVTQAQAAAA